MMIKIPIEAFEHAEREYPRESCGLIVDGEYVPCRNSAQTPAEHFVISPSDYKSAMQRGDIVAVIHSHPDYPAVASAADIAGCEESQLPWAIIPVENGRAGEATWIAPCGWQAPLIGREFVHGIHDCLSIILDFYQREVGIDLGTYDREDGWWNQGKDYYQDLLPKAGFVKIQGAPLEPSFAPQRGDVILMQIRSPVPNHAAIYLDDGILKSEPQHYPAAGTILHHLYGRDSKRDPFGGYWLEKTVSVWRYESKNNPSIR